MGLQIERHVLADDGLMLLVRATHVLPLIRVERLYTRIGQHSALLSGDAEWRTFEGSSLVDENRHSFSCCTVFTQGEEISLILLTLQCATFWDLEPELDCIAICRFNRTRQFNIRALLVKVGLILFCIWTSHSVPQSGVSMNLSER